MPWHKMRGNAGESAGSVHIGIGICSQIVPGDSEFRASREELLCIAAVGGRLEAGGFTREREIKPCDSLEFWDWLATWARCRRSVTIWGWGIGRALALLDICGQIEAGEFKLEWTSKGKRRADGTKAPPKVVKGMLCLEDPPTIVSARHALGAIFRFQDLRNFFRCEARALAKYLRLDFPPPYRVDDDWQRAASHASQWSKIASSAARALVSFVRSNDLGVFRGTIAGQALGSFRHRGMKHEIVAHDVAHVQDLERGAYYGGQTELWAYGPLALAGNGQASLLADPPTVGVDRPIGPVYKLDVNALFPYVMMRGNYPSKLIAWSYETTFGNPPLELKGADLVAEVLLDSPKQTYPRRTVGPTVYATGQFWTRLAGPELHRALRGGHVREFGRWAQYDLAPLFAGWMKELYENRLDAKRAGNDVEAEIWKGLANCLYGKFGQLSPRWVDATDVDLGKPWGLSSTIDVATNKMRVFRSINWRVQEMVERRPKANSLVAISAFITSAARVYMDDLKAIVPRGALYYQGIDSLHVHAAGMRELDRAGMLHADRMGALKPQGSADNVAYYGRCDYQFGAERVLAGAKADCDWVGAHAFSQTAVDRFDAVLARGPGAKILVRSITYRGGKDYQQGCVMPLGWVTPIKLDAPLYPYDTSAATSSCPASDCSAMPSSPAESMTLGADSTASTTA